MEAGGVEENCWKSIIKSEKFWMALYKVGWRVNTLLTCAYLIINLFCTQRCIMQL